MNPDSETDFLSTLTDESYLNLETIMSIIDQGMIIDISLFQNLCDVQDLSNNLGDKIGSGKEGSVYIINTDSIPNSALKLVGEDSVLDDYIEIKIETKEMRSSVGQMTLNHRAIRDLNDKLGRLFDLSPMKSEDNYKEFTIGMTNKLSFKFFRTECDTSNNKLYIEAYTCFSAYILQMLCSKFTDEISINFIKTYGVSVCEIDKQKYITKDRNYNTWIQYYNGQLLMEKVDGDLLSYPDEVTDGDMIQVMCAIYAMQKYYKLSHNDLNGGNILYIKINDEDTFNGQLLIDADYFEYTIIDTGQNIYIPNNGVIFKIADFGFSVAYDVEGKIVGSYDVLADDFKEVPSAYKPIYDTYVMAISSKLYYNSDLFIAASIGQYAIDNELDYEHYIRHFHRGRPLRLYDGSQYKEMKEYEDYFLVENMLQSDVITQYSMHPGEEYNIINIGQI